jgi:hypothetical protein
MKRKNTKRKRRLKKRGFLFFDLLGAFAISTVLVTIVFICVTFLSSRFVSLQEYADAKRLLYQTTYDLEQGIWYASKNTTLHNTVFRVTNQQHTITHTPITAGMIKVPVIKTIISWHGLDKQEKQIVVERFYASFS